MADTGGRPRPPGRPRGRLFRLGDFLYSFGLLCFFFGPVLAMPKAVLSGSLAEVGRAAAVGFGLPLCLCFVGFLLTRVADRRCGDRSPR